MQYIYKVSSGGKIIEGVIEASDKKDAIKQLRQGGRIILTIKNAKTRSKEFHFGFVRYLDKMLFTEHLSALSACESENTTEISVVR